jgi:hypothetical protein
LVGRDDEGNEEDSEEDIYDVGDAEVSLHPEDGHSKTTTI